MTFVDTVDSVSVAEGCESALTKYAKEICPDKDMDDGTTIAYGSCANKPKAEIQAAMELRRKTFCASDLVNADNSNTLQASGGDAFNTNIMNQIIKGIYDAIGIGFTAGCEETYDSGSGEWLNADEAVTINTGMLLQDFYKKYLRRFRCRVCPSRL